MGKSEAYVSLSKGWVVGSSGFRAALIKDHSVAAHARAWEKQGAREIREQAWEECCTAALKALGRTDSEVASAAKSAPWKVAIAALLKERTQASNPWLARRLAIGRAKYVSHLVTKMQRATMEPVELQLLRRKWET